MSSFVISFKSTNGCMCSNIRGFEISYNGDHCFIIFNFAPLIIMHVQGYINDPSSRCDSDDVAIV